MKIYSLLFLLVVTPSYATTKAKEGGQRTIDPCQIRAKFESAHVSRIQVKRGNNDLSVDQVFWKLDVFEVSSKANCPPLGRLDLRVRGASFRGTQGNPEITYAIGVSEPEPSAETNLQIEFSKGMDTFTKQKFEEWFLKEQLDE